MILTEAEIKVILEEAEKAKIAGFCRQTFQWTGEKLTGVQLVVETNKDELKARLEQKAAEDKLIERGAKPLTKKAISA